MTCFVRPFLAATLAAALCLCATASALAQVETRAEIRVGLSVSDNAVFAPVAAAVELGFFNEAGLSIHIVPLRGDAAAEEALGAGHVDVIDHTIAYAARAIAAGAQLKIIATATRGFYGWSLVVRADNRAASLSDLAGAKIGVGPRLSVADMAARRLADMSHAKFNFIPTGPGALVPALRTGELDAVLYSASVVRREAASGNARTILDLTDLADRTAIYGYSASRAMRETRGDDLRAFMSAVHRAAAHMQNDRAWTLRFLRTFANITDSGLAESLFDQVVNRLSTKGVSDPEEVRRGLSLAARAWNDPMLADIEPELVYSNEFLSPDL